MASFKNYVVNYDLVVKASNTKGLTSVGNIIKKHESSIQSFAKNLDTIQGALTKMSKVGTFSISPTINLKTFNEQSAALVAKAETLAGKISAILSGAFNITPGQTKTKKSGGKKGGSTGAATPITKTITENITRTTEELQKEAETLKNKLQNVFGKTATMQKLSSKKYKQFLEKLSKDPANYAAFKNLRRPYDAVLADISESRKRKNKGKITKAITRTITEGVKEAGKAVATTPTGIKEFNKIIKGLSIGSTIEVPLAVVANANTTASVNTALGKIQSEIKPLEIPLIVKVTNDTAKSIGNVTKGLQNSTKSTISSSAKGSKGQTAEEKALNKELKGLKSEENKYNHWLQKHKEWQDRVNAINAANKDGKNVKLPKEPEKPKGVRKLKTINSHRARINQRLSEIANQSAAVVSKSAPTSGVGVNIGNLQGLAKTKPIILDTRVISTGQAGFDLRNHIARLQQLALATPLKIDTRIISTGQSGFDLRNHIARLQRLAATQPIKINTTTSTAGKGTTATKATGTSVPLSGVVENVTVSSAVKVAGGPVKVSGVLENVGLGKNAKVVIPDITKQVKSLKELSTVWKSLPKTGRRTYTVTLKTPGIENIPKLKELAAIMATMPMSTHKNYSAGIGTGDKRRGVGQTSIIQSTAARRQFGYTPTTYRGQRKANMNSFGYQLMGNTSLGARTPMLLDMMKGMGMMTGVGAIMGTLTDAFSNASSYQNTMVTARAILQANYKGKNFNSDFQTMSRIVRDVAKQTKFTAPQAADAARFMAMAGLDIPMINASIRPIADVAVIGDNDLGEVADKITNIQTAFGIKPEQMRSLADALTKTFTSSNTDMMMLAESMEYAAPMAHLAGAKIEDALAMIGIMGNAGIQGSMAGTTLRMMYQNIINPNKRQSEMWDSLGINLKDEKGNPRQLISILSDLRSKVRLSKEDKDIEGNFKDEGTPVAEAVSKLFRVTASAGAGTLLENLDKVIALANANRSATGLSESVSLVKQNTVQGMWAKMTSAFTDAVVNEFENGESPIKKYLSDITEYFKKPEFASMLHDLFNLVTSMADMLGNFVKIWRKMYSVAGDLIKYAWMAQFVMAQIGYTLAPFASIYRTFSRGATAIGAGVGAASLGSGAASGSAGMGMATGMGIAASGMIRPGFGHHTYFGRKFSNAFSTNAIVAAKAKASQLDTALANSRKYYMAASTHHQLTTPALERSIAHKQMQWLVASNLVGSATSLRAYDNRSAFWNLAYTNPKAASELPNRFKIMQKREAEVAALQAKVAARNSNVAKAQQMVTANAANAAAQHRVVNQLIAKERHRFRRPNADVLNRAVRMGKISSVRATGMTMSSKFLNAATWGITGFSAMGLFSNILGKLSTLFGALVNPITLAIGAIGGLAYAIYAHNKKINEAREEYRKHVEKSNASTGTTRDSIAGKFSKQVIEERKKLGIPIFDLGQVDTAYKHPETILAHVPESVSGIELTTNPLVRNTIGASDLFLRDSTRLALNYEYRNQALNVISAMSKFMYGKKLSPEEVRDQLSSMQYGSESYGYFSSNMAGSAGVAAKSMALDMNKLQNEAAIASVIQLGANSFVARKAADPIIQKLNDWVKITDPKQSKQVWTNIIAEAQKLAAQYNPQGKGYASIAGLNAERIGDMRYSDIMQTEQYQQGVYASLSQITNPDNPIYGYYHALNELKNNSNMGIEQWFNVIGKVADSAVYQLPDMNGQMQLITQKFENGKLSWAEFQKNIAMYGLQVKDAVGAFHEITYQSFLKFREIAIEAGRIPPTIQEYLKTNGVNYTQQEVNTWGQDTRNNIMNKMKARYQTDPAFKNQIDSQYGDWGNFVDKSFGKSGWLFKTQNYPDAQMVNDTENWYLLQRGLKEGFGGTTPTNTQNGRQNGPFSFLYRNWFNNNGGNNNGQSNAKPWNIWRYTPTSQSPYASTYGNPQNVTSNFSPSYKFDNLVKIDNINGLDGKEVAELVGKEVIKTYNMLINTNNTNQV